MLIDFLNVAAELNVDIERVPMSYLTIKHSGIMGSGELITTPWLEINEKAYRFDYADLNEFDLTLRDIIENKDEGEKVKVFYVDQPNSFFASAEPNLWYTVIKYSFKSVMEE